MSHADLIADVPLIRSQRTLPRSLAVLIEVPKIKARPSVRSWGVVLPRMQVVGRQARRGRRRLRREVRFAGCALMALVPILSACTLGWSNRPDRILACSIADPLQGRADSDGFAESPGSGGRDQPGQPAIASPGVVVLSIEPAVVLPGTATEAPVIFPGYVLPDDSREDLLHEGS